MSMLCVHLLTWLKIANGFQTKFDSYYMFCRNTGWVGSGYWSNNSVGIRCWKCHMSFNSGLSMALAFFLSISTAFWGETCSGSAAERLQETDAGLL